MSPVRCSYCRTLVQLPSSARSVQCPACHTLTRVCEPHASHRQGQKRAVLCGLVYKGTPEKLKGCINDVKWMKYLLITKFNFPESSIRVLTEQESDPRRQPTRKNVTEAMRWLVQGCRAGDSLVFYFSGHGGQEEDSDGDEQDGFDETLLPLDHETEGEIPDDEINTIMVNPLPAGVKLHAIMDTCHSGTVFDLPYRCRMDGDGDYEWKDHRARNGVWKGTKGGKVIAFSGCKDSQSSEDASTGVTKNKSAMTYAFIKAIKGEQSMTYGDILNSMDSTLAAKEFEQEPQLTTNMKFDLYSTTFSL